MAIRRGPGYRHDPPPWRRHARIPGVPPFAQFVFLSMLLHALAVLLFGAPSGGSSEGRAMWGSLQVVLGGAAPEAAPPPTLKLDRGLPNLTPRPKPAPLPAPAPLEEAPQPTPSDAPVSVPQLLDRLRSPELKLAPPPEFIVPPPTLEPVAPALAPAPPAPKPAPAPPPPEPAPKVEPMAVPAPLVPVPPVPALALPPLPVVPRVPPVEVQALPTPTITPPAARPLLEMPPLPVIEERIAPPRLEPIPAPKERVPVSPPALKDLPAVERTTPPAPPSPPPAAPAAPASRPGTLPGPTDNALLPSPFRQPPPKTEDFPGGSTGYDPTAPPLDTDAIRKRAGQLSREGTGQRSLFAAPVPAPRKSRLEAAIENARKPDCKDAYKDLGLLAALPLIANEFGEGTCRW